MCITDALTPLTELGAQSTLSEGVDRWENRHPVEREVAGCCECVCGGEGPKCKLSEAEITIDYKILLASNNKYLFLIQTHIHCGVTVILLYSLFILG